MSIWSILKNCIGKELSKITMPVVFNEPLTMLQRACEGLQYSNYLVMADSSDNPIERMEYVCAFIIAALSGNSLRIVKPFNPLLYETFEIEHDLEDGTRVKGIAQQVSHHPPITAAYAESNSFSYSGVINPKIKFWGRSVDISHDGVCKIHLKRHNESYIFKAVPCSIHNIIVGKLWFEHNGSLDIKCSESNLQTNLTFKQAGWFSSDLHRFDGFISSGLDPKNSRKLRFVYGKWTSYIKSVEYSIYENYMKENQNKLFRIPDDPDQGSDGVVGDIKNMNITSSINNNSIGSNDLQSNHKGGLQASSSKSGDKKQFTKSESSQSLDIPNSKTIWRLETQFFSEYYYFSPFTMKLNELTPHLAKTLPRTDSRFRPDVRKLEEGDLDGAANEKHRLEERQREIRCKDKRFKEPSPDFLWFETQEVSSMKEKHYVYKGGYWENKCNTEKFPDLF